MPHVFLHDVFRFLGARIFQDPIHSLAVAEQDVKDLGVSVRFIPRAFLRQRLRIARLVIRKVLPKDFRQMIHKNVQILTILEIFTQERLQRRED